MFCLLELSFLCVFRLHSPISGASSFHFNDNISIRLYTNRMLLHHAIKHEYGGWRVWVDTLAIVHSKVSYEEFKLQFAQMYEHYERHRTDNITDPALRRAHPISTISGWDQDRDDSSAPEHLKIEEVKDADNNQTNYHATNGISNKSDQANNVDMDNVKCACDGDDQQQQQQRQPQPQLSANKDEEAPKLVSSISSISDVYNKQINGETICDGNRLEDVSEETSVGSPEKEAASGQEALKQVLEIDSYEKEEESKEIVEEIIENILQKSEALLEDCKNTSDLNTHDSTSSPVIKDDEIELAVSEVVKGVLEIEKTKQRDNETTTTAASSETIDISISNANEAAQLISKSVDIDNNVTDDPIKTDLLLSTATIANNNQTISETIDDTNDEIQGIITNIVHEVIDNCLEQTILNDNEKCDNNNSEAVVTQTAVEVVEKVLDVDVDTAESSSLNTNEEIAKSILYEIVDKCVKDEQQQIDDEEKEAKEKKDDEQQPPQPQQQQGEPKKKENEEENNNDGNVNAVAVKAVSNEPAESAPPKVSAETFAQTTERMEVETGNGVDSVSDSNSSIPASVHNERRPQSASTSTQVENNHFGEWMTLECVGRRSFNSVLFLDAKQPRPKSGSTRPMFSPGPTRPPFRIPEFKWSYIHQRLLSDVLFSLETDIQVSGSGCFVLSLCKKKNFSRSFAGVAKPFHQKRFGFR